MFYKTNVYSETWKIFKYVLEITFIFWNNSKKRSKNQLKYVLWKHIVFCF